MSDPILKLFPPTEKFQELTEILAHSIRSACLFGSRTLTIEHLVFGYMRYIEYADDSKYTVFPWYLKSMEYLNVTQLDKASKTPPKKITVSDDVSLLSKNYRTYRSEINIESFYYLMVYLNINNFNSKYILPSTDINHCTIFTDTTFGYFLKQSISCKYTDMIKRSKSPEELNAWSTLYKGYNSLGTKDSTHLIESGKNDLFHISLKTSLTKDITHLAYTDNLPIIVGRNAQISRLIDILSKVKKHNAIMIGNPGVGKKSIVYGIAQKIVSNDVPRSLVDYTIMEYDAISSVAGCEYRGSFEARIKEFETQLKNSGRKIILFIEDIDSVVNVGRSDSDSSFSLSSMLKTLLDIPNLRIVGTTTLSGIRKIEKNKVFNNLFDTMNIEETSFEDTLEILQSVSLQFERTHEINISESALKSAITLSSRFITERHLPDKAIDVLDEACAIKRNSSKDISNLELTPEDVMNCISKIKDIPVNKIKDSISISNLEAHLSSQVIGQNAAIEALSCAIRRTQAGLTDNNKPIASFMFIGPTGVGKTEIAKVLADTMFPGGRENLIRFDMSEYMEKTSVSKLIGADPGCIGYEESGQLTEQVKHHPYSLILFDEIEKAHPNICDILLQVLDEGWLTDGHGEKINFRNTIIILTSNVGSENYSKNNVGFGTSVDSKKHDIMAELKHSFRAEFLNRIDEIIPFNQLNHDDILQITHQIISYSIISKMEEKNIHLDISDDVINEIAQKGYSLEYGARAIRRTVIRELVNPLSDFLLQNNEVDSISIQLNPMGSLKIAASNSCLIFN